MEVKNGFKGLDLIESMPEELRMEVRDIVQEAGIKTIPKKKKCEKAKRLSEEALQIVVKRREAIGKGEKERYTHLNEEFQRLARRDEKAFLSDQAGEGPSESLFSVRGQGVRYRFSQGLQSWASPSASPISISSSVKWEEPPPSPPAPAKREREPVPSGSRKSRC